MQPENVLMHIKLNSNLFACLSVLLFGGRGWLAIGKSAPKAKSFGGGGGGMGKSAPKSNPLVF
jgi:hypothetical protein